LLESLHERRALVLLHRKASLTVRTMTAPGWEGSGWRQRHEVVWRQALSH
jgi:hypothetical protein